MPLSMVSVGNVSVIQKVTGRDDVRKHLADLGFVVGEEVTVVNRLGGNMILSIKNSRVALDQTLATRIMV
jgi:ferrous iron transport protein A